jgi:uncharacterized membrane protein
MTDSTRDAARLEAFSDGVFAIAITLLALNIKIPPARDLGAGGLPAALLDQWPVYLAFVISFLTILVMWANHHNLFKFVRRTDHAFLYLNGLLLLGVTFIPIPTALVAEYARHPEQSVAAAIYSGTFALISLAFNALRWYAVRHSLLVESDRNLSGVKLSTRSYLVGPLVYGLACAAAWISPLLSLGLSLGMALFYTLPPAVRGRLLGR